MSSVAFITSRNLSFSDILLTNQTYSYEEKFKPQQAETLPVNKDNIKCTFKCYISLPVREA